MHSLLTKAKDLGLKGREKLEQYSSGKLGSDEGSREGSPSFSRKRREAALKADLFAGPDKIVSAGNTYGLIKLTVHEAKMPSEQRYCAVVSIGMQVNKQVFHPGSSHWVPSAELTNPTCSVLQTYMSRTEPKATCNPVFEEGRSSSAFKLRSDCATGVCQTTPMLIATMLTMRACHPSCTATATSDFLLHTVSKRTLANAGLCLTLRMKRCITVAMAPSSNVARYTDCIQMYKLRTQTLLPRSHHPLPGLSGWCCHCAHVVLHPTAAMQAMTNQAAADCHNDTHSKT